MEIPSSLWKTLIGKKAAKIQAETKTLILFPPQESENSISNLILTPH